MMMSINNLGTHDHEPKCAAFIHTTIHPSILQFVLINGGNHDWWWWFCFEFQDCNANLLVSSLVVFLLIATKTNASNWLSMIAVGVCTCYNMDIALFQRTNWPADSADGWWLHSRVWSSENHPLVVENCQPLNGGSLLCSFPTSALMNPSSSPIWWETHQ